MKKSVKILVVVFLVKLILSSHFLPYWELVFQQFSVAQTVTWIEQSMDDMWKMMWDLVVLDVVEKTGIILNDEEELDTIEETLDIVLDDDLVVSSLWTWAFVEILDDMWNSVEDYNWIGDMTENEKKWNKKFFTHDAISTEDSLLTVSRNVKSNNGNFLKKHIYVILPVGAQAFDEKNKLYKKKIIAPKIENKEIFVDWDNYQLVFSVWWNKHLHFEYADGSPAYADFYVSLDGDLPEQDLPVYFSQDGAGWNYLDEAGVSSYFWQDYLRFQSDHFTYFAIGTEEWSFLINDGDLNTNSTWVVLTNNVQNMSGMRFWNTTWEVLSANFETFSTSKNRFLTTGDGTKFVYAIFEDNFGNTGMVFDSIVLDTTGDIQRNNYDTLPVMNGLSLRFDADDSASITTWVWDIVTQRNDKSNNDYHADQTNGGRQPVLVNNAIINKSAIEFSNDFLNINWLSFEGTDVMSGMFACVVFRSSVNGNDNDAFISFDRNDFWSLYYSSSETVGFDFVTDGNVSRNEPLTPTVNDDEPHISCASYNNSLTNDTQIYVDGVVSVDIDNTSPWDNIGESWLTRYGMIGDENNNGTNRGRYFNWHIGELIFYGEPVSTNNQKKVQCYLWWKWWIDLWYSCEHIESDVEIVYDPTILTSGDVIASLSGLSVDFDILNNNGLDSYIFTENGIFEFLVQDGSGNLETFMAEVDWIDKTKPTASVDYDPDSTTSWEVLAMLTGFSETGVVITNNAWSGHYIFDDNGSFVFEFKDEIGNTGEAVASVTWIENTGWVAYVVYDPKWPTIVSGNVIATLTWENEPFVVTNNGGSENYTFTGNGEFVFEYSYSGWTLTGNKTAYVDWIDNTCDTWSFEYSPDADTYGDVIVTITWFSETGVVVTNNSGSVNYVFTGNGSFVFELIDSFGNTGESTATVDRIQTFVSDDLIVARKISDVGPMERESVSFEKNYTEIPFVFVTPVTENTTDTYPIPLVRNVTTGWFQITSCVEQGNSVCSTTANDEDFHYFVVDSWDVAGLSWMDVDTISTATDGSDTSVSFNKTFANTPYVRTTPQTYNQWWNNGMVAWVDDGTLSASSMDVIGCRHNGNGDGCTAGTAESVAYLAIDVANANITGFQYGTKSISNSTWTSTSFGQNYGEARIMVTENSDNGAQDPEYAWAKNVTNNSADIRFCEQDWAGDCDSHTAEDMVWFTLEGDVPPTAEVVYSTTWSTNQDVIATLTWESEIITITNNGGSRYYTFTENWTFVYQFKDSSNNTNTVTAEVTWIDKNLPPGEVIYDSEIFDEDPINNDGSIDTWIILNLSGDTFVSNISWYVEFVNVPSGLTGVISYISGTQINIFLTGFAVEHSDTGDVVDLWINFLTWAFEINAPNTVTNAYKNDLEIDFNDPFSSGWFYPVADTLLDADTEPANGCDDGNCQEANYGALNYMGASDFGSVSLIKFDLNSIPTGSVISSATLELTRMDIGVTGTWFELMKIINNPGWIEWVGSEAWDQADKALVGEPNYKQRKWTQENWNNGEPWFVSNSDYTDENLLVASYFDTQVEENKIFQFNTDGVEALQDWLDYPDNNQWFAFLNANYDWTIIYTREEAIAWRRPQLFINYNLDIVNPVIESFSPADGETWVVLDANLFVSFDEKITAVSGYDIVIKKSVDDSIFETINAGSNQVSVNQNSVTIDLSGDLLANTWYYIQIASWAFVDRASNPFTGILDTTTWNFFTVDADNVPMVTWATASWIEQTTGTLWWEIISTGSATVTERGIYRDLMDGFNPLDGTKISETWNWNNVGSFTVPVSNLPAGLRVYYRAFAYNEFGNWYSEQESFLTKSWNPVAESASSVSNYGFIANWESVIWADSYELYVATDSGFTSLLPNYGPKIGIVGTEQLVENLSVETNYYYKLVAKNDAWYSQYSNIISVTTSLLPFPIMHLKLEESAGSVAYDAANTHDGILDGWIVMQETGIDNKAFYFDGSDDKLTVVDFGYGPDFTMSVWFKKSSNVGTDYLFSHGDDNDSNSFNVYFDSSSSSLKTTVNWSELFEINGSDYTDLLDDERHLYTLTVDDNYAAGWKKKIILYIDGEEVGLDQTTLVAWSYNPTPNITVWRRSIDTAWTYFEWTLDDVRMYNQMLSASEVQELYDNFVTDLESPFVSVIEPLSGAVDVDIEYNIEIVFSKDMDKNSVEATWVITFAPVISGLSFSWSDDDTVLVSHDNFDYETEYIITINSWAQDLSGVNMETGYVSSFTTMKNLYLTYDPTIFVEESSNVGAIQNEMIIILTGDVFSTGVVSSGYVVASNIPNGLTGVFVRDSDIKITFSLTGNATNHGNVDDVDNLTIVFDDAAFVVSNSGQVSRSIKNDLKIDFNDPDFTALFPTADTTLDINNKNYNYGESTELFVGDGSFMLVKFDLSNFPVGATINSATLTFRKTNGAWSSFEVWKMINNPDWVEWLKLWSTANDWESVYNQRKYNQENWSGGVAGLVSWTDYDATYLVDNPGFSGNESRIFDLNSAGIATLSWWIADANSNEWFVLYGGNDKFMVWASEHGTESYRPKLLINYTPSSDVDGPVLTGISIDPGSPITSTWNDVDISVDFESDEYPLYITFNLYSSTWVLVSSTGEYLVNNSWELPISYPFVASWLLDDTYDLYMSVDDTLDNNTNVFLWQIILDRALRELSIGAFSGFTFSWDVLANNYVQEIEEQVVDYFYVKDTYGIDSWYYTTIQMSDLTWFNWNVLASSNVFIKWSWVDLLTWTSNSRVELASWFDLYHDFSTPITFIKRDTASNFGVKWQYGVLSRLKIAIPAYQSPDEYQWVITFILYEY